MNISTETEKLAEAQLQEFELAKMNYANLKKAAYKTISIGKYTFELQYNPDRIRSTAANITPRALQTRKCFLCSENLPAGQKGIPYGQDYHIFVNPYPIFQRHFTVPATTHRPQLIKGRFPDMLALAKDFPAYTIFYNGPCCGASAPDHFHFQMAQRQVMPLEKDIQHQEIIQQGHAYTISTLNNYLRKNILCSSMDCDLLSSLFTRISEILENFIPSCPEPMINLLTWYSEGIWTVAVFPRRELRPWQFFAEGAEKILFSPGCVDFAGLLVTPRKEDFDRYTPALLADLFGQLTLTDTTWEALVPRLQTVHP